MDSCDMDAIAKRIYELTKDDPHFKKQQFKTQRAETKGKAKLEYISKLQKANYKLWREKVRDCREMTTEFERERNLSRTWMHIDMDMFYAAVEIRDKPELAAVPLAVGSMQMITTANYVARKFGVRSAMPGFLAYKLCPELVLVPCNYSKYKQVSEAMKDMVAEYDPHFSSIGLDEVNLDVTDFLVENDLDNATGR